MSSPEDEEPTDTSLHKADNAEEVHLVIQDAKLLPVSQVSSDSEAAAATARFDPIEREKNPQSAPDGGLNVVHSLINRTIFFDYFRHVANKRFSESLPEDRVDRLAKEEPRFYKASKWGDFIVRAVTVVAVIGLACALVVKALFA